MSGDTREKILQAAFTVLSRQGYENTSIKEIAEEAGVAQGLVHYYYKSKQQLVLAVLEFVCKKVELGVVGEAGALVVLRHFAETLGGVGRSLVLLLPKNFGSPRRENGRGNQRREKRAARGVLGLRVGMAVTMARIV